MKNFALGRSFSFEKDLFSGIIVIMADNYNPQNIEKKWQEIWEKDGVYKTEESSKKPKQYILDMFPYPSGAGLHVGHPRGYIGSDVLSRMRRMQGFNVLHPMGFDAFGLPAEQYAIQTGEHPSVITEKAIETYKKQLELIGLSYDWSREVRTIDPQYYKWTQWIFLKLFESYFDEEEKKAKPITELVAKFEKEDSSWNAKSEKEKEDVLMKYRLAYEGLSEVNWCEELGTVLANDEIVDGLNGEPVSERGGFPVVKKEMKQMFLRITSYADRLLSGLETIDWPEHIKEIQRNWIGRSVGAEIEFSVKGSGEKIKVFTTRPDTLFGVTYLAVPGAENKFTGKYAINPANGEEVPVWEADYVLEGYGTGAVMGVPAHDERDFEFAKKNSLEIKEVIEKPQDFNDENIYIGYGVVKNSVGWVNGLLSEDAAQEIVGHLGAEGVAKFVTKYKMRDAVFARQRYWGEPIPLRREDGIIHPLREDELPLELPKVDSYKPAGNGESPLAGVSEWVSKGYETNTMPGWAGSSWYFLRYMDPHNEHAFARKDALDYWQNVDVYIGGAEHATGHLLYARFWNKFLHDLGYVPTDEPFALLKNQGLILASDGRKMSKRWGNVVNPDEMVDRFGADAFRLYEMFIGPFDQYTSWNTDGLVGTRRFLERVWRAKEKIGAENSEIDILVNKTIKKISDDIENFRFNTSVSSMMILVNKMEEVESFSKENYLSFLQILAPFAPHMTEELWHELGEAGSIHTSSWPKVDESKLKDEKVKIAVQVNGKVRAEIEISPDASEEEVKEIATSEKNIAEIISGAEIKKFIYVAGKIVNIVI